MSQHQEQPSRSDSIPERAPDRERAALPAGVLLALGLVCSGFVLAPNALAIPSPDVVIGLFASVVQVLGLVSVVAGGWLWRRRRSVHAEGSARGWKIACAVSTALLLVTAVGWSLYASAQADERARRLQTNLERSSKEDGKKIQDVSLKELSFSDQLKREDGIQTEDLARQIAAGETLHLLDVRESEECEMGMIQGARHARFPDVLAHPEQYLDAKRVELLLCYNGNRSSEMATALREQGFECRFMIGGYEKWLTEERPLANAEQRTPGDLRQVPGFPNRDVLLDTPDVLELMQDGEVQFVDVRYPLEFEGLGHLPGAINLTFRKLESPELERQLAALPKKPVIVACYDKRSSFYGLITGLRLSRLGYEFLGRYTTPETFPSLSKDKPHVAAWKKRHDERTLLSTAAAPAAGWVQGLAGTLESLALAIVLAALALRLLVLPLTLRADRDRWVQLGLAGELAALERRFAADAGERSRRTLLLLREHRIRPVLGFASGILQLVLFSILFAAVGQAVQEVDGEFLWIRKLSEPDPLWILPLACALLAATIVVRGASRARRARVALALVFGLVVGGILTSFSAAVGLYLAVSLGFVLLQGECARWWILVRPRRAAERRLARARSERVVPLGLAALSGDCGNKAARLARLLEAGIDVPGGFVLRPAVIQERLRAGSWDAADRAAIERALAALGAERVAVRSSGASEDGAQQSFAGVFESVLDVGPGEVFEALERVLQSFTAERVKSYAGAVEQRAAILVQAMVPAQYAGVLFTEHPEHSGVALVELVEGLGEALVSGRSKPRAFRLGRLSGRPIDAERAPIALEELQRLGLACERLFGRPQDVEWAWSGGRFRLLQSRDITRGADSGEDLSALRERERRRLLALARAHLERNPQLDPESDFLVRDELAEFLPRPTPASISLLDGIAARGGSTDLACRELGLVYEAHGDSGPVLVSGFGRTWSIAGERSRRLGGKTPLLASFRLGRGGDEIEREFREEFLPEALRTARLESALDLARLELGELLELHQRIVARFLRTSYREAERINLAAEYYMRAAVAACAKHDLDPAAQLAYLPADPTHLALEILARVREGKAPMQEFLRVYGHRADHDYELSEPRYQERPEHAWELAARARQGRAETAPPGLPPGRVLRLSIERARRFQALKEEAKHAALRDLAALRRVTLEIGARLGLGEGVFQLEIGEIAGLGQPGFGPAEVQELVRRRQERAEAFEALQLPTRLSIVELEALDLERGERLIERPREGLLCGTRVSGSGDVVGRARVLASADEIETFERGEILVARFTDPAWMPVFAIARGLVMEVGGWLSHAAIQAREYGLTCVVGVEGACEGIRSGELLRLCRDGRVERLPERRRERRVVLQREIHLRVGQVWHDCRLLDVSPAGAQIEIDAEIVLASGSAVALTGLGGAGEVEGRVARNGRPGNYGLQLVLPRD